MAANAKKQIEENRRYITDRGGQLTAEQAERAQRYGDWSTDINQGLMEGTYLPMLAGEGGYTPDEQAAIMREGELRGTMTTPEEFQGNYLTPDEINRVRGNTWDRTRYYDPNAMNAAQEASKWDQRAAVNEMKAGMEAGITPDLAVSDRYQAGLDRAVSGAEADLGRAVDVDALRADPEAVARMRMSDQEVDDASLAAATSAGVARQAQIGALERQARAAGVSPIGVSAARDRYERAANAEAVDAQVRAKLAAQAAQRESYGTAEGVRQAGERSAAGYGTDAATAMAGLRERTATNAEGMRLGAAQDVSSRRMDAAQTTGQARLGSEQAINEQQRQQAQYNTSLGTEIATGMERDTAAREAQIAQNRQDTAKYNQQQRYGQGYDVNSALSGRAAGVAGARRADAQEARQWYGGMANTYNQNAQADLNRQQDTYGQQTSGMLGTTKQQISKEAQPSTWGKVAGTALGAAKAVAPLFADGGVVTEPTLAVVGEAGPEAVVPLRYRQTAVTRPSLMTRYMRAA